MSEIRLLLTAIQYFTRIPVPAWVGHSQAQLSGSARYFPAVGLLVGCAGAGVLWLAAQILPSPLPVILSTVITVLMTGAFHEDGLADTFDGLGGGATRERALEIMKDSRVGTYGAIALILTLLLKIAALSALPMHLAAVALIGAHSFSRACAVSMIFTSRYVGSAEHSRAKPVAQRMSAGELFISVLVGVTPLILCGMHAIVGVAAALVALLILFRWFTKRLDGYTGDTLGATQQITEVTFYLALLAAWTADL
jgi:adenosylcobinamide-GDP ribazoletransferase